MIHNVHMVGVSEYGRVFVEVQYRTDGRLSITGVVGPRSNGDARGSCGQIVDSVRDVPHLAEGWTPGMITRLVEVWERWHLNDMQAGSPRQRAWLEANPISVTYPESHYVVACERLAAADLNPDTEHGDYAYGSAWLREEVPEDVIEFLAGLPTSDALPTVWWSR